MENNSLDDLEILRNEINQIATNMKLYNGQTELFTTKDVITPEIKSINNNLQLGIVNVVASFSFGVETIPSALILNKWTNASFQNSHPTVSENKSKPKKSFPSILVRLTQPKVTASITANGKCTLMGAGSIEDAKDAATILATATILTAKFKKISVEGFSIDNVVWRGKVNFSIMLRKFMKTTNSNSVKAYPAYYAKHALPVTADSNSGNKRRNKQHPETNSEPILNTVRFRPKEFEGDVTFTIFDSGSFFLVSKSIDVELVKTYITETLFPLLQQFNEYS